MPQRKPARRQLALQTLSDRLLMAIDVVERVCQSEPKLISYAAVKPSAVAASMPASPSEPVMGSLTVPQLASLPSSTKKIYLDFDGQTVTDTVWNSFNEGSAIHAAAYTMDADAANFSAIELETIREIWARVAEDFRPFDVDVTTIEPPTSTLTAGSQAIRVIISTNVDENTGTEWFDAETRATEYAFGGTAYLNSWTYASDTPVWVFANLLSNGDEKLVAETASHQIGRAFNLLRDGSLSGDVYYAGHGDGAEGWAPIMGSGKLRSLTQWSSGEYSDANQTESDLSKLNAYLAYRVDDYGGTVATATQLVVDAAGGIVQSGIIERANDKDAFTFSTRDGLVTLDVQPFEPEDGKANLDVGLTLLDETGSVVTTMSPLDQLGATISLTLPGGAYTLLIDGIGRPQTTGHEGYSDYGSLGAYTLSGSVVPNYLPVANPDEAATSVDQPVLLSVLDNDTDGNMDPLLLESVSLPTHGSASILDNKIQYTPDLGFVGSDTFTYEISDGFGGTAIGTVTIVVTPAPQVAAIRIDDGSGQRSMIRSLEIEFDQEVTLDPDAIVLVKRGTGGGAVQTQVATETVEGRSIATITFVDESTADFVSPTGTLVDGNYQLTILGSAVHNLFGVQLDGDSDQVAGGNRLFGTVEADAFFRLYGDVDGSRSVAFPDFLTFAPAYGKSAGEGGYVDAFDVDRDETIGFPDFLAFAPNYGKLLPFV